MRTKSARSKFGTLKQICDHIPGHFVAKLARKHGVDEHSRSFTPWSHVVTLLYAQLAHATGLNNVADGLRRTQLQRASAPFQARDPCRRFEHYSTGGALCELDQASPPEGCGQTPHAPRLAIVLAQVRHCGYDQGQRQQTAREICADISAGEIVLFDKAYVDFEHLYDLDCWGVFWVTRAKENMSYRCVKRRIKRPEGRILCDEEIVLKTPASHKQYPKRLRLVRAIVERDGKDVEMAFITNNFEWAPSSVADLYKHRWGIEAFFKQIKQTLQLCAFLGYSKNTIQWQVWMALLAYILPRYLAHLSNWPHSFTRLFGLVRCSLWSRLDLLETLRRYGTAGGDFRLLTAPEQAYLPGFSPPG